MYNSILVPIDFTDTELITKALKHVEYLANTSNAQVLLLHVLPFSLPIFSEYSLHYSEREVQAAIEKAKAELQKLIYTFDVAKEKITIAAVVGAPRSEILKTAAAYQADLIVIGSRNPNIATQLLGSTAAGIVNEAKISVLVVR